MAEWDNPTWREGYFACLNEPHASMGTELRQEITPMRVAPAFQESDPKCEAERFAAIKPNATCGDG